MAVDNAFYIVDVFVPNRGEPESALELTILRVVDPETLPQVYVHTYIRPELNILSRIHWSYAASYGISRDQILGSDYPTFHEIVNADYLRDKSVVCLCENFEPIQTLVAHAQQCYSLLNMWQEVFAGDEDAGQIAELEQMLSYMGLPTQDASNCHYTPLMKRCRAQIAVWMYLFACMRQNSRPPRGFNENAKTVFWPLDNIPEPWYDPQARDFTDIPPEAIAEYFSERLPEFVHWSAVRLYGNDWRFARERNFEVKIVDQDAMLNFIFYRLFDLPKRLMVLTFYALCEQRTLYARVIALHQGQFNTLQTSVKEDFGAFVISHLTDFLLTKQKHDIIRALVDQVLQAKFEQPQTNYDFDELYKKHELNQRQRSKERAKGSYFSPAYGTDEDLIFVRKHLELNRNIFWYQELRLQDEVLLRRFIIKGNDAERDECIDHINAKIEELIGEAKTPLASCWLNAGLKQWIEFITGFAWSELSNVPKPGDAPSLSSARRTIQEIIAQRSRRYYQAYISNLRKVTAGIDATQEGEHTILAFMFQGIAYEFDVDKSSDGGGLFAKIRQML